MDFKQTPETDFKDLGELSRGRRKVVHQAIEDLQAVGVELQPMPTKTGDRPLAAHRKQGEA